MSDRARAYQESITGRAGQAYRVNGVDFDGYRNGVLLEAKGPGYSNFLENGQWELWYTGTERLLSQAGSQLAVANGYSITWYVAEQDAADAIRRLLKDNGYGAITVIYQAP
jgi:hypothetical protein